MYRQTVLAAVAAATIACQPARAADPAPLAPTQIVAAAPVSDWTAIAPADLLVMDLAPVPSGKARRVVIQLIPAPFSFAWVGNIRMLAAAHWWDATSINRVQDNYVVQWGDPDGEDKVLAKPLPPGLLKVQQSNYVVAIDNQALKRFTPASTGESKVSIGKDSYADGVEFRNGWPFASDAKTIWPIHCYGTVGVGRDMPPDTGTGAELYAVIGQAPRQLDRNIAIVGRVIEGMEYLASLPRGTGDIGFYKSAIERVPIRQIRLGGEVPDLPRYQYLTTDSASFKRYAEARANRRDPFYIKPAGGVDVCNVPVPVRRVP
ncbi:peptidylprolyl isomerase [Novosphingobium sp. FKTRR1]|uniref:peptidylprolyl isomerase n=1 Tax=Novosphingobium sp. FKTRR1 TaxID=2879118 RepID=UPI001CF02885|nr:peptidylprolyl isomerase [Novosphingobium sp. FKTRR1]